MVHRRTFFTYIHSLWCISKTETCPSCLRLHDRRVKCRVTLKVHSISNSRLKSPSTVTLVSVDRGWRVRVRTVFTTSYSFLPSFKRRPNLSSQPTVCVPPLYFCKVESCHTFSAPISFWDSGWYVGPKVRFLTSVFQSFLSWPPLDLGYLFSSVQCSV